MGVPKSKTGRTVFEILKTKKKKSGFVSINPAVANVIFNVYNAQCMNFMHSQKYCKKLLFVASCDSVERIFHSAQYFLPLWNNLLLVLDVVGRLKWIN